MKPQSLPTLALVGALAVVIGCGGADEKPIASVSGTVTFNGAPVKGGSLSFAPTGEGPEPGMPGTAEIQDDGTYTVMTYGRKGAVVGPHTISYSAPSSEADETAGAAGGHVAAKPSPYDGLIPKETSVTVEAGGSTVDIELVKP